MNILPETRNKIIWRRWGGGWWKSGNPGLITKRKKKFLSMLFYHHCLELRWSLNIFPYLNFSPLKPGLLTLTYFPSSDPEPDWQMTLGSCLSTTFESEKIKKRKQIVVSGPRKTYICREQRGQKECELFIEQIQNNGPMWPDINNQVTKCYQYFFKTPYCGAVMMFENILSLAKNESYFKN